MNGNGELASIVIGFRNWGLARLELCLKAIDGAFGGEANEVVVSDFGSSDPDSVCRVAVDNGARFVHTPSEVWSRSRALNRGFAIASGDVIMATDADMLFSPGSLAVAARTLRNSSNSAIAIQCRDLPEQYRSEEVERLGFEWDTFDSVASLRPRWGMGGLFGTTRRSFESIGGYDERMHTYGGEDLDFAQRCQRAGLRILWLDDPTVRMFHMWHAPSRRSVEKSPVAKRVVEANTQIVKNDPTIHRNVTASSTFVHEPLVSVVIATRNRGAYLIESINSVLAQTVQDFELIVVNDGSTDNTLEALNRIKDRRMRVFSQPPLGISAARNLGTDRARGRYIAVHDDDDVMLPSRIARSISAIRPGVQATFGSWVNFDDETGELALNVSKKDFGPATVFGVGAAPGHSTWLVERELLRRVRYDEHLTSAVDHNLAVRLLNAGVKWAHVGRVLFLRRMHSDQVTVSDGNGQRLAAILTSNWYKLQGDSAYRQMMIASGKAAPWPKLPEKEDLEAAVVPYLPDHLAYRHVLVRGRSLDDVVSRLDSSGRTEFQYEFRFSDSEARQGVFLRDVPWADLPILAASGLHYDVIGGRRTGPARISLGEPEIRQRSRANLLREISEEWSKDPDTKPLSIALMGRRDPRGERTVVGSVSMAGHKPLLVTSSAHTSIRDAEIAAQALASRGFSAWAIER